eukprot:5826446-Karenia_brevis.AAC.1
MQLNMKRGQEVRVGMILDRSQFYHSSCIRQALRAHELWHNRVLIKVMLPKRKGSGRGCPTMHCKTT